MFADRSKRSLTCLPLESYWNFEKLNELLTVNDKFGLVIMRYFKALIVLLYDVGS